MKAENVNGEVCLTLTAAESRALQEFLALARPNGSGAHSFLTSCAALEVLNRATPAAASSPVLREDGNR